MNLSKIIGSMGVDPPKTALEAFKKLRGTKAGFALGAVGILSCIGIVRSWRARRYRGQMTWDQYTRFLAQSGYGNGVVQQAYNDRKKAYLMGSEQTKDQLHRIYGVTVI